MKALIALPLVFLLNGCVLIDSYFMASFDNNEYSMANKIRTQTQTLIYKCTNKEKVQASLEDINVLSLELKNYTQYIPNNKDAELLASNLHLITSDTIKFYIDNEKVSSFYCKKKLKQIVVASEKIQETYGRKPR